jgi:hypothetical protein
MRGSYAQKNLFEDGDIESLLTGIDRFFHRADSGDAFPSQNNEG